MHSVLIIQEIISSYRKPIYELINSEVKLTVGYTHKNEIADSNFEIKKLPTKTIFGFCFIRGLRRLTRQYDVIIIPPHLKFINSNMLPFIRTKCKIITWSIGLHITYNRKYNLEQAPSFKDKLTFAIFNNSDAAVFYMPEPIEYWKKYKRIREDKCFVAHNTVEVAPYDEVLPQTRSIILFVGTLYKQKGIGELLDCYAKAKEINGLMPPLVIIGKGPEKDSIETKIKELNIEDSVELKGAIYDESILKEYFTKSIICVSPKQAGLSVLKSLGYGVPFVTRKDAITGGELFNLVDNENGIFYSKTDELVDILVNAATNRELFANMSKNARETYLNNCKPEVMAKGILDAINYSMGESCSSSKK